MTEQEHDLLAAEYVVGTLDATERAQAKTLLETHDGFRALVAAWEKRLAPLQEAIDPVTPTPELWPRIAASTAPVLQPDNDNVAILTRSVARWRMTSILAGAIAAGLALFIGTRDLLQPATPVTYVAAVNRGGDLPALIVRVDMATHQVSVRPVEAETPAGKSLELWYIADGAAPKSMGVVEQNRPERRSIPAGLDIKNLIFAVTVEPPGGSPSGAPTGPVVYKGSLIRE